MKAVYFREHGKFENLKCGEIDAPSVESGFVLVRVITAGLNRLDHWVLKGWRGLNLEFPHVCGSDAYGEVVAVSNGVKNVKPGERVIINPGILHKNNKYALENNHSASPDFRVLGEHISGTFCELVAVPEENVFVTDSNDSPEKLGSLGLVAVTAWRMLFTKAKLKKDEVVVVVGTGGGLNSLAMQLAAKAGAKVIAITSSEEKENLAKDLGAFEVVNYTNDPTWHRKVLEITSGCGAQIVVDNVGKESIQTSIKCLGQEGRLVTVGNTSGPELEIDNRYLFTKQLSIFGSTMGSIGEFNKAVLYCLNNNILPIVDSTYSLENVKAAYTRLSDKDRVGKVVFKL